jgi:Mn2+/Fe2+ NRAMP family transporter
MEERSVDWTKEYPKRAIRAFGKGLLIGLCGVAVTVVALLAIVGAVTLATTNQETVDEKDPEKYLERSISEIKAQLFDAEFELAELRKNS